jgi:hypothetical protein
MVDFVFFVVAISFCIVAGFASGYHYSIFKFQKEDLDYNITIIKEDIVALNMKLNYLESLLQPIAEDRSL